MKSFVFSTMIIIAVSVILMELLSFGFVYFLSVKNPDMPHLKVAINRFHPLFRGEVSQTGNPIPPYRKMDENNPFTFNPHTGYANKPGSFYDRSIKVGSDGFLCNAECNEITVEKPENQIRIFILGGSTVAGSGVDNGALTISGQLEEMIAAKDVFPGKECRVINAAIGGAFSFQELVRYVDNVLKYDPNMVIFFDGHNDYRYWQNDINNNKALPNFTNYDYSLVRGVNMVQSLTGSVKQVVNMLDQNFPVLFYSMRLAKEVNRFMRTSDYKQVKVNSSAVRSANDMNREGQEKLYDKNRNSLFHYLNNLEAAAGVSKIMGIKGLFCLQPTLGYPLAKKMAGIENDIIESIYDKSPNIDLYFENARREFGERAERLDDEYVRFQDMTTIFNKINHEIYVDNCHYNAEGNKIIAENILTQILQMF
ncbi:SGNH/GDSL hydrolase family protein [Thermodesulfobacteriota bacterium]